MFDIRNKHYMIWGFVAILFATSLVFVDLVLLPYQKTEETIENYGLITQGKSKTVIGYRYLTNKGTKFSLDKDYIRGEELVVERTLLFKEVVSVQTQTRDYTPLLSSGFNGFTLVLIGILTFSTILGLLRLLGSTPLTINQYQNCVLFTFFMLFCVVGIWFIFN